MRQTSKVVHRLLAEAPGQHRVRLDVSGGRQLQDSIGIAHDAVFFYEEDICFII